MNQNVTADIYQQLGVTPVVNALGSATILGGSVLHPKVQAAMQQANQNFVIMHELLDKAGDIIADRLGTEAAFVTSGCFAALALCSAGIMTGTDQERITRLPDTTGLKNEFLIQKRMRFHYDRAPTVAGGRLQEVGNEQGTTAEQLAAAIGPRTAAIFYPAHMEGTDGTLSFEEVRAIARDRGVVMLVDAASQIYPLERMTGLARGYDLVCFSAKYLGGPNSTGFLCGRKTLVEAAARNGFIAYETEDNHCFGRGYKVDRQEVVATVTALRAWFAMDHQAWFRVQEQRIQVIATALSGLPHVQTSQEQYGPWRYLWITLDEAALGKTAAGVEETLRRGDPPILLSGEANTLHCAVHTLNEGEDTLVARRLREALSG